MMSPMRTAIWGVVLLGLSFVVAGCKSYPGGADPSPQAVRATNGGFALLYNAVQRINCKQRIFGEDECDTRVQPLLARIGQDGHPENGAGDAVRDTYDYGEVGGSGENALLALDGGRYLAAHGDTAYALDAEGEASVLPAPVESTFTWADSLLVTGNELRAFRAFLSFEGRPTTIIQMRRSSLDGIVLDDVPVELARFSGLAGSEVDPGHVLAAQSGDEILLVWHMNQEIFQGLRLDLDGTPIDAEPIDLGNVDIANERATRIAPSNEGWMVTVRGNTGATFLVPRKGRPAQVAVPVEGQIVALAGAGSLYFVVSIDGQTGTDLEVSRVDLQGSRIDTQRLAPIDSVDEGFEGDRFPAAGGPIAQFGLPVSVAAVGNGSSGIVAYPHNGTLTYKHLAADGTYEEHHLESGCAIAPGATPPALPALLLAGVLLLRARRRRRTQAR